MKFESFKSGTWKQQLQFKSFQPTLVDHAWVWEDASINLLLEQANRALGELNAFSIIVPDIDMFTQMHVLKEAQTSSLIEGTQTGIDDAIKSEDQIQPDRRDDWNEVQNYIKAMNWSVGELEKLPLSNRLLKDAHRILMQGVRGKHKQPGEFRSSQNWIGGSSLADAVFVPPSQEQVPELMSDLEKFWHDETITVPHLIRIAISHYQFETIHPFNDGNGRTGRLLITLYLIHKGLLAKPSLYLSDFFERNRTSYYDALMRVRLSHDLIHWVRFFLRGVAETATKGRNTFQQILALRLDVEQRVSGLGRRAVNARLALHLLYRKPIIRAVDLEKALQISTPTANALIGDLRKLAILTHDTGTLRNRTYTFEPYLRLFLS